MCTLTSTLPFLTVQITQFNIPSREKGDSVIVVESIEWNFSSTDYFLNARTTATESHAGSANSIS